MKFKNLMFATVAAIAVSCGSKETKENVETTDATVTETPAAEQAPAAVKDMIAQNWVLDDIKYEVGLNAAKDKEAFKAQMEKLIVDIKGKAYINIGADGKVTMDMVNWQYIMKNYTGTWTLIDADKTLNIVADGVADPFQWAIWEITPTSLSLLVNDTNMTFVVKK